MVARRDNAARRVEDVSCRSVRKTRLRSCAWLCGVPAMSDSAHLLADVHAAFNYLDVLGAQLTADRQEFLRQLLVRCMPCWLNLVQHMPNQFSQLACDRSQRTELVHSRAKSFILLLPARIHTHRRSCRFNQHVAQVTATLLGDPPRAVFLSALIFARKQARVCAITETPRR